MSGNKLFIDTNIAVYLLSGDKKLAELLSEKSLYISFITQLELQGYKGLSDTEIKIIQSFISQCTIVDINDGIKATVIEIRKNNHLKLPDAIIMASSIYLDIPIITADKDFKKLEILDLLFYKK